jgi:DNA invertase Pin-like site-specific DNA recombinase
MAVSVDTARTMRWQPQQVVVTLSICAGSGAGRRESGAMAEFERSLIQERVKAGLRHAKQKGKRLGRPRVIVDAERIGSLRASGASWRTISEKLGVGIGTLYKAVQPRSEKVSPAVARRSLIPSGLIGRKNSSTNT